MSLEVIVISASDLPNLESMGKIDPYVSVEYHGNDVFLLRSVEHCVVLIVINLFTDHLVVQVDLSSGVCVCICDRAVTFKLK